MQERTRIFRLRKEVARNIAINFLKGRGLIYTAEKPKKVVLHTLGGEDENSPNGAFRLLEQNSNGEVVVLAEGLLFVNKDK